MDRKYVIGFLLGVLVVLSTIWANSLIDTFQSQEKAKMDLTNMKISLMEVENRTRQIEALQSRWAKHESDIQSIGNEQTSLKRDIQMTREEMRNKLEEMMRNR